MDLQIETLEAMIGEADLAAATMAIEIPVKVVMVRAEYLMPRSTDRQETPTTA